MKPYWYVTLVSPEPDYWLYLQFRDGCSGRIRLPDWLNGGMTGVFAVLLDPARFAEVYLDHGAPTWPGGIDLAPDALHDDIAGQSTGS